ncbi:MAG: hypothetical protein JW797_00560 [Bradymonadales bacterium]|nr:hypothetical protein [Bradymonadales bacterium]
MNENPITTLLDLRTASQRIDQLMEHEESRRLVALIDPPALFCLVKEVGIHQASDLVQRTTPDQLQTFLDLDCWNTDQLAWEPLMDWLAIVLEGDDLWLHDVLKEIDLEILALFLLHHVEIHHTRAEETAERLDRLEGGWELTPDGVYLLVLPKEKRAADLVHRLIDRIYCIDQELARHLLEVVRFELPSVMMETAYQIRNSRLEQYGFPPVEEAMAIYAPVNPSDLRRSWEQTVLTEEAPKLPLRLDRPFELPLPVSRGLIQLAVEGDSEWGRTLAQLIQADPSLRLPTKVLCQLVNLVNQAIMADHHGPKGPEEMAPTLTRVHGFLNVGLQYLTRRESTRSPSFLSTLPLKSIFQVGYNLVRSLQKQAQKLVARGNLSLVDQIETSLCSDHESELIGGLLQQIPIPASDQEEGFQTLDQIEEAAAVLTTLAYKELWTVDFQKLDRSSLVNLLVPSSLVPIDQVTFDSLLATRAALRVLDERSPWRLIDLEELRTIQRDHIGAHSLSETLFDSLVAAARPPTGESHPASFKLSGQWAQAVAEELIDQYGRLTESAIHQPRFLPPLLLFGTPHTTGTT